MRRTLSHAVLCALALLVASCVDSRVNSNNSDPEAAILEPAPDFVALLGESVTFRGTVDDGPTATDDLEVSWSSSLDTVLFEETPDSDGETTFTTDALSLGEHTITLRVLDPQGASGTDAITITIEEPEIENTTPTCAITEPEDDAELDADDTVVFEGTADDGETAANELTATWSSSEDGELGVVSPSSSGAIALPVNDLSTGTHVITLDVSDGELNCSEFIVVEVIPDNFPPSIGSPAVTPDPLYTNDIAQCVAPTPTDPEGDSIDVALRWLVDGNDVGVTIDTLAGAQFSKGQSVVCEVTPSDATGSGASMTSPTLLVSDTPPTAPGVGIAPVAPVEGIDDLVCSVTTPSADLDGEIVTYAVSWALNGVTWSGATSTTTLPGDTIAAADAAVGTWNCTITPTAASVNGPFGSASVTVGPQNQPPTIGAPNVTPASLFTNTDATCNYPTPVDPEGDSTTVAVAWLVNGSVVGGATTTLLSSANFSKGQTVACEVTPSDPYGSGIPQLSPAITVLDSPPTQPGVNITPSSPVEAVDALVCAITAASTDADNETVTYGVSWTFGGAAWTGATSTTTWTGDTIPGASTSAGLWQCTVTPTAASINGVAGTASVTVNPPAPVGKLVFVTSTRQNGALGGTSGADAVCQTRANAAGLGGTYKAWISGSSYSSSPASRFTRSTSVPYVRVDGALVANNWADLTDGTIANPINIDEFGNTQTYSFAWSFTRVDGSQGLFGSSSEDCYGGNCHCNNWTITATQGSPTPGSAVSRLSYTNDDWTDYSFGNFCGSQYGLKCFEQ